MSWNQSFAMTAGPQLIFGAGKLSTLPSLLKNWGKRILIVTGGSSFTKGVYWPILLEEFEAHQIQWRHYQIKGEPSPAIVDKAVENWKEDGILAVVGIGGGSVLDAGKAIAAMLCERLPVRHFLEGVGDRPPSGKTLPFIAIPTTAGTGSEATKNAVLSEVGKTGFKKSLRHDHYVPEVALIDPKLMLSCPQHITAYSGMDAFTQLLESYVSIQASPITDALALDGLRAIAKHLETAVTRGTDLEARAGMAYAALLSGFTLANAGLGTVHGFASSVGGRIEIPHGALCGSLMGICNRLTVPHLEKGTPAWSKYERVGRLFFANQQHSAAYYIDGLLDRIDQWVEAFALPRLGTFGLQKEEIPNIAARTSNKFNPVQLSDEERQIILQTRL